MIGSSVTYNASSGCWSGVGLCRGSAGNDATLPANFIREVEYLQGLYWRTAEGVAVHLIKWPLDESRQVYGPSGAAGERARAYTIRNNRLQLFPSTTVPNTFYLNYYKKDTVLDSDTENLWLREAPEVMIGNAGASVAQILGNEMAFNIFSGLANTAWTALVKETILRETANRRFILGRAS